MRPDDLPETAGQRTKRGDIWKLGEHRLMVGDSSRATDMARLMGGVKPTWFLQTRHTEWPSATRIRH